MLPVEFEKPTPHAPLVRGTELSVLLRRERGQLDIANEHLGYCPAFYNDLRNRLKGAN